MAIVRSRRVNTINTDIAETAGIVSAPESVSMDAAMAAFLRRCRVRNLTKETLRYYEDIFADINRYLGAHRPLDVTQDDVETYVESKLKTDVKATTVNMYLRGFRAFFAYLNDEGFITENPAKNVKALKTEKTVIETFSKTQLRSLLETPNRATFTGYRNYVIMLTLIDTGMRLSELEGMRVSDINWSDRAIKVRGKGRKERMVPFQLTLDKHLREYIAIRGMLDHDYVFVNIDNNPIKKRTVQEDIRDIGKSANIKGVRVSPHTFRHTFAKMYVMNGGDAMSLQKILGHTTLEMVRVYVNMFATDITRQHRKYSPLDRLDDAEE